MKPFRFRLEALLTLRLREEDKMREALAYAETRRAKAEEAQAAGEAALEALDQALMNQRQGRLNCQNHLLMLQAMETQRRECVRLATVVRQSRTEAEYKRQDMMKARREREMVEHLRDKQKAEYQAEVARAEEREISDMIGARHALALAAEAHEGNSY
jgi:flagellar protein FliJ